MRYNISTIGRNVIREGNNEALYGNEEEKMV